MKEVKYLEEKLCRLEKDYKNRKDKNYWVFKLDLENTINLLISQRCRRV